VRNTITEGSIRIGLVVAAFLQVANGAAPQDGPTQNDLVEKGRYLIHAGGCITCHTADTADAPPLAGGRALETPFGTFYAPNITPDAETGIGTWSDDDFLNALWNGVSPKGSAYYPAFPYTSYSGVTEEDALAMKAYLFSLEPVHWPNRKHELRWFIFTRMAAGAWKSMNFRPARFVEEPGQSADWNRGAYLVRHLGHCGECHTPRTRTGVLIERKAMTGNTKGSDEKKAPDITTDKEAGIGRWSMQEIELFLEMGLLPDGDFTGGSMSPVIDDNTSQLIDADRHAIAVYLKSLRSDTEENAT